MKWHLRGFCLFSGLPKSHFNVSEAENAACGDFVEGKQAHEPKAKTTWRHETISAPGSPSFLPWWILYITWAVCVTARPSYASNGEEAHWGKLTRLPCTKLKSHKAFVFREHHHYFIFPGKWTAQFCLITSRALMHYEPRSAFATLRLAVRRRDKPYRHSWGRAACLMIISHFARLNSIFWIKDSAWCSEWMEEKEGATGCRWKEVALFRRSL